VKYHIIEIKALQPNATWKYCPMAENLADLLSRGITTAVLMLSSLYQHGSQTPTYGHHLNGTYTTSCSSSRKFVPLKPSVPDTYHYLN